MGCQSVNPFLTLLTSLSDFSDAEPAIHAVLAFFALLSEHVFTKQNYFSLTCIFTIDAVISYGNRNHAS